MNRKYLKENDWEYFFINFFKLYNTTIERKEYKNGLTLYFEGNEIYVYCDLNINRDKIKKLEFGRIINGTRNWIKGIFIDNRKCIVDFKQTSWSNAISDDLIINYNNTNINNVYKFLEIPCKIGWKEEEYRANLKTVYKVKVILNNEVIDKIWNITLYSEAEQDIPLAFDKLEHKLLTIYYDSFIYKRRHIDKFKIASMKLKKLI